MHSCATLLFMRIYPHNKYCIELSWTKSSHLQYYCRFSAGQPPRRLSSKKNSCQLSLRLSAELEEWSVGYSDAAPWDRERLEVFKNSRRPTDQLSTVGWPEQEMQCFQHRLHPRRLTPSLRGGCVMSVVSFLLLYFVCDLFGFSLVIDCLNVYFKSMWSIVQHLSVDVI